MQQRKEEKICLELPRQMKDFFFFSERICFFPSLKKKITRLVDLQAVKIIRIVDKLDDPIRPANKQASN